MSLNNDRMNTAKKNKNNEFYTTFEHMECLFQNPQLDDVFIDKVVYLPCDTEESKIYQYLLKRKDELQIKEILRTSDDYYSHLDLYEKADIVFTNPPFTGLRKYVRWLEDDLNKKFILFSSWMTFYFWIRFWNRLHIDKKWKIINNVDFENILYDTPTGKIGIQAFVFTNIETLEHIKRRKPRNIEKQKTIEYYIKEKPNDVYFRDDNILFVKNALYLPRNYYGEISIQPFTYETYSDFYLELLRIDEKDKGRYIVKRKKQTDEKETD